MEDSAHKFSLCNLILFMANLAENDFLPLPSFGLSTQILA